MKKYTLEKDTLVFVSLTEFSESKLRSNVRVYGLLHEKTANNNFENSYKETCEVKEYYV